MGNPEFSSGTLVVQSEISQLPDGMQKLTTCIQGPLKRVTFSFSSCIISDEVVILLNISLMDWCKNLISWLSIITLTQCISSFLSLDVCKEIILLYRPLIIHYKPLQFLVRMLFLTQRIIEKVLKMFWLHSLIILTVMKVIKWTIHHVKIVRYSSTKMFNIWQYILCFFRLIGFIF